MHENFTALDNEKRDRIINAAMREFAAKGYRKASTNEIVKNAGISKGALFHYFGSKQDLFEYLYSYGIDYFTELVTARISDLPSDIFERWISFARLKIEIAVQHPDLSDFMQSAYLDEDKVANGIFLAGIESFTVSITEKLYRGLDMSKFRPEIDAQNALQIIKWTIDGYVLSKRKVIADSNTKEMREVFLAELIREMEGFLNILKTALYKEENL